MTMVARTIADPREVAALMVLGHDADRIAVLTGTTVEVTRTSMASAAVGAALVAIRAQVLAQVQDAAAAAVREGLEVSRAYVREHPDDVAAAQAQVRAAGALLPKEVEVTAKPYVPNQVAMSLNEYKRAYPEKYIEYMKEALL